MIQEQWISFDDALEESKNLYRAILLGNGFSVAQTGGFFYSNLLKESDIGKHPSLTSLMNVFHEFETFDFEKIIRSLETAAKVAQAYGLEPEAHKYIKDSEEVREQLIKAIQAVHPSDFGAIHGPRIDNCVRFLKNFGKVFTLNYDLLLYWVSIYSRAFKDGFGYGEDVGRFKGPFKTEAWCNIYNIHGGLHLFLWPDRDVYKAIANRGDNLLSSITSIIRTENCLPLYVAEGTSEQKLKKIRSVPYLNHCLKELQGLCYSVLFVFGHSGGINDEHIYDAIFKSNIHMLYYCVYDENQLPDILSLLQKCQSKKHHKRIPIKFIDARPMNVWGEP